MRTLLIGHPDSNWEGWFKAYPGIFDHICLNPGEPTLAPGGNLVRKRAGEVVQSRFYGSSDPARAPHMILEGLFYLHQSDAADLVVELFPYRPSPLLFQTVLSVAWLLKPDQIFVAAGTGIDQAAFPIGPSEVSLPPPFPPVVQAAQRKAQWIAFLERCSLQTVPLKGVAISGGRLGSGRALSYPELKPMLELGVVHAEEAGSVLSLVAKAPLAEAETARLGGLHHAKRTILTLASDYCNLYCGLARQSGEDFALGLIQEFDFERNEVRLLTDAVPPVATRILRLGGMKVDPSGNELEAPKPWSY